MVLGLDFSGGRVTSPTGQTGTLVGNAAISGRTLALDGSGDYLTVSSQASFSPTNGSGQDTPISFAIWVNHATVGVTQQFAVFKNTEYQCLVANSGAGLQFACFSGGNFAIYRGRAYLTNSAAGAWTHYAFTYDGSETTTGFRIYKNAVRVDNADVSGGAYAGVSATANAMVIGYGINGSVADFRCYSSALTSDQISQIYNAGAARIALGGTP